MVDIFVRAFLGALLAEIKPDKTFCAGATLATRFALAPVALGAAVALTVKTLLAAFVGQKLFHALPPAYQDAPRFLTAATLLLTAFLLFRRADAGVVGEIRASKTLPPPAGATGAAPTSFVRAALATFALLFFTEWFDRSQLIVMGIAADGAQTGGGGAIGAAGLGGVLALMTREIIAITVGARLQRLIAPKTLRRVSAVLRLALAVWTIFEGEEGPGKTNLPAPASAPRAS